MAWSFVTLTLILCEENGIRRHKTIPGTPQRNGQVERMNKTILDKVRCMLSNSKLPKNFWVEVVQTTTYLISKSPSSAIKFKTPKDIWSGKPVDYNNQKVFKCMEFSHVNEGELSPRAKKCAFLGYPDGIKGFRLRDPEIKRCFNSRNVTFVKDATLRSPNAQ